MLYNLEKTAKDRVKIPLKKEQNFDNLNINRMDALGQLHKSMQDGGAGKPTYINNNIRNVMKHDYLKQSMEDRVHRKNLIR